MLAKRQSDSRHPPTRSCVALAPVDPGVGQGIDGRGWTFPCGTVEVVPNPWQWPNIRKLDPGRRSKNDFGRPRSLQTGAA